MAGDSALWNPGKNMQESVYKHQFPHLIPPKYEVPSIFSPLDLMGPPNNGNSGLENNRDINRPLVIRVWLSLALMYLLQLDLDQTLRYNTW